MGYDLFPQPKWNNYIKCHEKNDVYLYLRLSILLNRRIWWGNRHWLSPSEMAISRHLWKVTGHGALSSLLLKWIQVYIGKFNRSQAASCCCKNPFWYEIVKRATQKNFFESSVGQENSSIRQFSIIVLFIVKCYLLCLWAVKGWHVCLLLHLPGEERMSETQPEKP